MKIETIQLQNWRNHSVFKFDFKDITILVGENASGKTNFLEAVYYLACGKSFRTKDENLIGWEKGFARIEGEIEDSEKKEKLLVVLEERNKVVKTVKIKGVKKPSSHLLGHLYCVLFSPEEIDLISTLPEARRRYLNLVLSQSNRKYAYNLIHYKKTLEHRNSLLRRINEGIAKREELEVWDGKLAEYGSEIMIARQEFVDEINKTISGNYELLSGQKQKLTLEYKPSIKGGWGEFISQITQNREKDIITRITNSGPHRDDFEFVINNKRVVDFASRGEFRTVILALKLSEVNYFENIIGKKPVLLLDDVFSELDINRRDLLSQIFQHQQTIVTTTDLDHVSDNIIEKAKVIEL